MSKNPRTASWEASIEDDHDAIKEVLGRMQTVTDPKDLLPVLEELRGALSEHFKREEEPDGLHEIVASMAPNSVASLQNVLAEHEVFTERLDRLIEQTRACVEGPQAGILRETSELTESLRDHEARETALFTDAVFTDLGRSS